MIDCHSGVRFPQHCGKIVGAWMKTIFDVGRVLLQFFPLSVFFKMAHLNGPPQAADWMHAYQWGGAAAILQFALSMFFSQGHPLNRIILGVNLYLMIGGVAVVTNQLALLEMLNNLKERAIFLCLLIVGILTTFASKAGFVGAIETSMKRDIRTYSIWLILLTCAALAASFWFKGQIIFSAAAPLIMLSVATRLFKRRLQRH
jgi:hypothetical protein